MIHWREFLIPYEDAVDELKNKLKAIRKEYQKTNEYSPIEFVTGRVKQVPSIIEKAKKLQLKEDEIHKMDDIGGIRIICQFEDDIYKIVELIRAREGLDLEIILERNYIEDKKASGYRSYHIIIKYPVYTVKGIKFVLIEIQIRTMAMNFWATIEHSLNYKYKGNIPAPIAEKLKKSAEAIYSLDIEMQEIRDEVISAQELFMHKSNTVTKIIGYISILEKMGDHESAARFRGVFDRINYEQEPNIDEKLENLENRLREAVTINDPSFAEKNDMSFK